MPKIKALSFDYAKENLCGWPGAEIAQAAHAPYASSLPVFGISGPVADFTGKRQMLFEFTRKMLGRDTPNYAQEIGDCVSFGGKNVLEYLQCVQIILQRKVEEFQSIFPPYFYGTSRVQIGHKQLGWSDGSTGVWLQEAIKTYGVLSTKTPGVPQYSGALAKNWGGQGPPAQFLAEGQKKLVKTTAMITNAEDAANALLSGYPIAVCSNQGFTMGAASDGFHQPRGSWGHCMTIVGFEDHPQHGLYFIVLNSWGDVHGRLKDFSTGEDLPIGVLRVKGNVVGRMLSLRDSFAYSGFDGFPDNSDVLNEALFDMGGN